MAENTRTSKLAVIRNKLVKFFKDVRNELKKVIWPTKDQLVNNTATVLMMCLALGILVWAADWLLSEILKWTLTR